MANTFIKPQEAAQRLRNCIQETAKTYGVSDREIIDALSMKMFYSNSPRVEFTIEDIREMYPI